MGASEALQEGETRRNRWASKVTEPFLYPRLQQAGSERERKGTERLKLKLNQAKNAMARPWRRGSFLDLASRTLGRARTKAEVSPQGHRPLPRADSGTDASNPRHQLARDGCRNRKLFARLPGLLRGVSNAVGAAETSRIVVAPPTSVGSLEAAETGMRLRIANSPALHLALPNAYFDSIGRPPAPAVAQVI